MEQKLRRDLNMGQNLRKLRLANNWSQEKLCEELQRRGCDISRSEERRVGKSVGSSVDLGGGRVL